MPKDIRVLIVEDDPFARDLMALLLTRDWRTQVIGEVGTHDDLEAFLADPTGPVDLILLDTEKPNQPNWPFDIAESIRSAADPPVILFTATQPNPQVIQRLVREGIGNYILKGDILYALASAVAYAASGQFVITPGVQQASPRKAFPHGTVVIDGRRFATRLTQREKELVRLGNIFNLAIRDIADELVISPGWVSEILSTIYRKLGMREILTGEAPLEAYFEDESVLARCRRILARSHASRKDGEFRKGPWMSTLAFHLLTIPEIDEV